jgi:tellurite resistance protein TehA-like permease
VFSEGYLDESHYGLQAAVSRTTPAPVLPLTTAGLLAGSVAGWLMAAWVFRRVQESTPTRRAFTVVVVGVGLLALFPATALSALALVASYFAPHHPAEPAWLGYTFMLFRPLAYLGAAAVVGGLLIAAAPGAGHRRPVAG